MKKRYTWYVILLVVFVWIPLRYAQILNARGDDTLLSVFRADQVVEVTIPPELTVFEALTNIFGQITQHMSYRELLSDEDITRLKSISATFYTETPLHWRIALRETLRPHELDYLVDDDVVRIGFADEIDRHHRAFEQERLRRNRTRIEVNFAEGVPLYSALIFIRAEAGINMNFDYMEPQDRRIARDRPLRADEVDDEVPAGPMTTYATPEDQAIEWRVVLREVLSPFNYDFIEVDGVVRPMKQERAARFRQQQLDAQPLVTRLVRVYHASPVDIVERISNIDGLFRRQGAFIRVVHSDRDHSHSRRFTGTTLTAPRAEGTTLGGDVGGFTRYGAMHRFRVPPSVLIGDVENNLERIESLIRVLDVREQQVVIEAKIFEVSTDSARRIGVDWERLGGAGAFESFMEREQERGRTREVRDEQTVRYELSTATTEEGVERTIGAQETEEYQRSLERAFRRMSQTGYSAILNPLEFNFFWEAVQQDSAFQVLSQPILVIGDHSEAVIRVGGLDPIVRQERTYIAQREAFEITYEADYVQTGISLWVVPEISPDGRMVRLSIHPQTLDNVGEIRVGPDGAGGIFPIFSIREIDTRVTVPSGHTLLLGGLIEGDTGKVQRKVPMLGDIPVLGRLFRWERDIRDGRNLVILMTPTILDDDVPTTGYEDPARPYLTDLTRGLGRDLEGHRPSVDETIRERRIKEHDERDEAREERRRRSTRYGTR